MPPRLACEIVMSAEFLTREQFSIASHEGLRRSLHSRIGGARESKRWKLISGFVVCCRRDATELSSLVRRARFQHATEARLISVALQGESWRRVDTTHSHIAVVSLLKILNQNISPSPALSAQKCLVEPKRQIPRAKFQTI